VGRAAASHPPCGAVAGHIGPNAITRLAQALTQRCGAAATEDLFRHAGLSEHLATPPQQMVDEAHARRLHGLLRILHGAGMAAAVSRDAGLATAEYLLAHRIPRPAQMVLRLLPAPLAARALLAAIGRHAWTFAGSGTFTAALQPQPVLTIRGNPLCHGQHNDAPVCDYYSATFERLFRDLVHPHARVAETSCEACGADACRFVVRW
jgi:divinyl protochlorophyllide a 8-vinyl-reductase